MKKQRKSENRLYSAAVTALAEGIDVDESEFIAVSNRSYQAMTGFAMKMEKKVVNTRKARDEHARQERLAATPKGVVKKLRKVQAKAQQVGIDPDEWQASVLEMSVINTPEDVKTLARSLEQAIKQVEDIKDAELRRERQTADLERCSLATYSKQLAASRMALLDECQRIINTLAQGSSNAEWRKAATKSLNKAFGSDIDTLEEAATRLRATLDSKLSDPAWVDKYNRVDSLPMTIALSEAEAERAAILAKHREVAVVPVAKSDHSKRQQLADKDASAKRMAQPERVKPEPKVRTPEQLAALSAVVVKPAEDHFVTEQITEKVWRARPKTEAELKAEEAAAAKLEAKRLLAIQRVQERLAIWTQREAERKAFLGVFDAC